MNKSNTLRIVLFGVVLIMLLASLTAAAYYNWRSHAFDQLIADAAREYGVPGKLIRAVIRRESGFDHRCVGKAGEIGLMQIMPATAREWAEASGNKKSSKYDLFLPETNIRAGAWYLSRALRRWSGKPNPLPYALAEYNAGRSNAARWAKNDRNDPNIFWNSITFPTTKRYVRNVMNDYRRQKKKH